MKSQFLPLAYWGSYRGSSIREDALNVIVTIEGKEAIPVRAIPLLTDWEILSPDVCARIFSGDDTLQYFKGMSAHRLSPDGGHQVMEQREWANWIARKLRACSERIEAAQASHESGYQQWRQESLALLPAGAFVWREAFEAAHKREYGPNCKRARFNRDTFNPTACELNYDPQHGPCENWRELVMEGFERLIPAPSKATTPAPAVTENASSAPMDGITTAQVAAIFDGLHYTAENWPKRLSDTKWLQPALLELGAAGGATSLWCPAKLAQLIHVRRQGTEKQKTLEALNKKFKNNSVLKPWSTDWNEHYEMFNDAN
ncbi:MAG: hypothetical protein KDE69_15795 [Burkholderiaceae bacterium]|nr:hypothetical protein [Burkholderiaceae bacterium]